ncbi:MAG TPA: intradiol ring-cleavage dioxygenase [Dermatophilaceae bacterium]|nr:intradiol ring-cleavage dioxygenase [Dermatophilaceae bacterium]
MTSTHQPTEHEIEDHDRGLLFDLGTLANRRGALRLFGGIGLLALTGCSTGSSGTTATTTTSGSASSSSAATAGDCVDEVPQETAGPYPGDGSNGPNVLTESDIVRSDITTSFGSSSGAAEGVPLTVKLTVQDASCAPLSGAAVYVWHCDRDGGYSLYSGGVTDQNYLRGVQAADDTGTVTFTSIFPGCYSGRWPHIHFEVYKSLSEATASGQIAATSQIALPQDACEKVYTTSGYEQSVTNLSRVSLSSDNVFGDDGGAKQLATMTGDPTSGYTAALTVSVAA